MHLPNSFLTACVGLFILGVGPFAETAPTSEPTPSHLVTQTYSPENAPGAALHCMACPPGHHVSQHCTEELTPSQCVPCANGSFSSSTNGNTSCTACYPRDCPGNSREVQACTDRTDRLCRCNKGLHCHKDIIDPYITCRNDPICGPGMGVERDGNRTFGRHCEQPVCETCKEGTFVNVSDPDRPRCQACSECAGGTRVTVPCSQHSDTQCSHDSTTSLPDVMTTSPEDGDSDHTESTDRGMGKEEYGFIGPVMGVVFGCLVGFIPWLGLRCRKKSVISGFGPGQLGHQGASATDNDTTEITTNGHGPAKDSHAIEVEGQPLLSHQGASATDNDTTEITTNGHGPAKDSHAIEIEGQPLPSHQGASAADNDTTEITTNGHGPAKDSHAIEIEGQPVLSHQGASAADNDTTEITTNGHGPAKDSHAIEIEGQPLLSQLSHQGASSANKAGPC